MLHATVEHQLDAPTTAQTPSTQSQDRAARAAVVAWQTQDDLLRKLQADAEANAHTDAESEPEAPAVATTTVRSLADSLLGEEFRHQVLAACVLLGLGLGTGWIGHRAWSAHHQPVDTNALANGLMRDAMIAHAVYAADARHPVEVAASEQDQLLSWLSRRLGFPIKLPSLTQLGWHLIGGRLLPGDTGGASSTRAQLMYEDKTGQRLTLYLSVLDPPAGSTTEAMAASSTTPASSSGKNQPASPAARPLFSFARRDGTHTYYWTDDRYAYALVGDLPHEALERISNEVYRQTVGVGVGVAPSGKR